MNIQFDFLQKLERYLAIRSFLKNRETFYEELAEAIRDGEAIARFLSDRAQRAKVQKDPMGVLYRSWLRRMDQEGGRMSHVLKGVAPQMDLLVISAIDGTENLAGGLEFLASTIRKQRRMKAILVSAVATPAVIVALAIVFMVVLSVMVVPVFLTIAPPEEWGTVGYGLYLASYAVTNFGILLGLLGAGLLSLMAWSVPNWSGPRRVKWDRYVPYRVFRDYNAATFLVAVAMMLNAGESLHRTMEELKKRSNPWLRWHINRISRGLNRATRAYGEAFDTGLLAQPIANRLIDSSRRSAKFADVVTRIGIDGMDKTCAEVEKSAKKLNVTLFIVMGVLVGTMILGTMRTGQELADAMQRSIAKQQRQMHR